MKRITMIGASVIGTWLSGVSAWAGFPQSPLTKCGPDAIVAGTVCLDKYEASVWRVPNPAGANKGLVKKIQLGKATAASLLAGGATQLGVASDDYAPCADNGQNCASDVYAVSLPGVIPSRFITWVQAQEACANSAKRMPTNAEWQIGANGTPDPGPDNGTTDCRTAGGAPVNTGSRSACVSGRGAFDMVGNLSEWVSEWLPAATSCTSWGGFSDDDLCLKSNPTERGPSTILRGGSSGYGSSAGPFEINGGVFPDDSGALLGFRCAR